MSQPYDSSIKAILSEDAEDIVPYLLPGATIVQSLNIEVLRPPLRADHVYQISYRNTDHILHLEFQVDDDKEMPHRLLCYHAILWQELKKPVISIVIYLFLTKTKIQRPPLREWSGDREILSFQYQLLEFWTIDARKYVQEHVVCMYSMLAMMQNVDVPLLQRAIEELVEYYRSDEAKLARRLLWFRTFLARATTLKREEKKQVEERLDVFDKLLEESPFVRKQKALARTQGETQGEARGKVRASQHILLEILEQYYPRVAKRMQMRIQQMEQPEKLHDIILQLMDVSDEQQAYNLLDGVLHRSMNVLFRPLELMDIDLILDLMKQFYEIDQYLFDGKAARNTSKMLIGEPALGRGWLMVKDAEVVGYVILTFGFSLEYHGRDATIDELFLLPEYRKQGIGVQAVQFLCEECVASGIQVLHLEVETSNEAALGLYRKCGFEKQDKRYLMSKRFDLDK